MARAGGEQTSFGRRAAGLVIDLVLWCGVGLPALWLIARLLRHFVSVQAEQIGAWIGAAAFCWGFVAVRSRWVTPGTAVARRRS